MATEADVRQAIRSVPLPELERDLDTLGMVHDLKVVNGVVTFTVAWPERAARLRGAIEGPLEVALRAVPGVKDVAIWHRTEAEAPKKTSGRPGMVRHVIAVGSGKGGVGKSTVSANLALALQEAGHKVGLLDADVYGPSIPHMFGVAETKPDVLGGKLQPVQAHGMKLMSMGFLLPDVHDPVVWRGPMLASAVRQLLHDVDWADTEVLVVDLPPGTGDVPLSLVQMLPLSAAVIVVTPQAVAGAIGRKTLRMLARSSVPIAGVVENMGAFACPSCGTETAIFSEGGGQAVAEAEGVPFLGILPLDPKVRAAGDAGLPTMRSEPQGAAAQAYRRLAASLSEVLAAAPPERVPAGKT